MLATDRKDALTIFPWDRNVLTSNNFVSFFKLSFCSSFIFITFWSFDNSLEALLILNMHFYELMRDRETLTIGLHESAMKMETTGYLESYTY